MSRKSLILCLSVLSVLLLILGVAIAVLYSGTGGTDAKGGFEGDRACLAAIPSDAVMVSIFDNVSVACEGVLSGFDFPASILDKIEDGSMASLRRCPMAVSLHYIGRLHGLYVLDLSRASEETVGELTVHIEKSGLSAVRMGGLIAISKSETLVRSASRHFDKNVSIADAKGFSDALASVDGDDVLLVSNVHFGKLASAMFKNASVAHPSFVERVSEWMTFDVTSSDDIPVSLDGTFLYNGDADEFLTVLEDCTPTVSEVAEVLPKYTFSFVSLPIKDFSKYISAYQSFIDSRQGLQNFKAKQKTLGTSVGIMPEELIGQLDIRELASATFMAGSRLEKVNLIRSGCKDAALIFKGNDVDSFKDVELKSYNWAYPSFISSVFGKQFSLKDETCFTYIDGWIISGSKTAVDEYVHNNALDYTLVEYLSDGGKDYIFSHEPSLATVYLSLTEDKELMCSYLRPDAQRLLSSEIVGADSAPAVFTLMKGKDEIKASLEIHALKINKTKAPTHERDTVVAVPAGPFNVKNSHTGKINTFYQNSHKAICLRDEKGKDLWGVPFGKSLCGTAHNVDYYANGKLQIIFGSGSSIYIIDRLGRYVTGFPLDLGREIVLGPDIYDFTGARRYNIMVLHRDNTIQMYNLKGKKPDSWKGITAKETIKSLPERLTLSGKDFWIVRTSLQTLIFPFYGGTPLTVFEGDAKLKPDAEIKKVDSSSVQAVSYDGKIRTIKLVE